MLADTGSLGRCGLIPSSIGPQTSVLVTILQTKLFEFVPWGAMGGKSAISIVWGWLSSSVSRSRCQRQGRSSYGTWRVNGIPFPARCSDDLWATASNLSGDMPGSNARSLGVDDHPRPRFNKSIDRTAKKLDGDTVGPRMTGGAGLKGRGGRGTARQSTSTSWDRNFKAIQSKVEGRTKHTRLIGRPSVLQKGDLSTRWRPLFRRPQNPFGASKSSSPRCQTLLRVPSRLALRMKRWHSSRVQGGSGPGRRRRRAT